MTGPKSLCYQSLSNHEKSSHSESWFGPLLRQTPFLAALVFCVLAAAPIQLHLRSVWSGRRRTVNLFTGPTWFCVLHVPLPEKSF